MKSSSATYAALTAAVVTAAVALPAAASTGTGSGGASPTPSAAEQQQSQQASAANYKPARATWYGPGLYGNKTERTQTTCHTRLPPTDSLTILIINCIQVWMALQ